LRRFEKVGLGMAERKAVAWETIRRYRQADRRGKTAILNEFVSTTELSRKYAIQLLKGTLRVHPRPSEPVLKDDHLATERQ